MQQRNKALLVGISDYLKKPLPQCKNDVKALCQSLSKHENGKTNFAIDICTDKGGADVSRAYLLSEIKKLLSGYADIALLYFSGHGSVDVRTGEGFIITSDGQDGGFGVSFSEIVELAKSAIPEIRSIIIMLDCCNSGQIGHVGGQGSNSITQVPRGLTVMSAAREDQSADTGSEQSLFTSLLLDALGGSASDILGRITPAAVYSHIDQGLGAKAQRPIYMANVQEFVSLRNVTPKIPEEVLLRIHKYFPTASYQYPLDPSFEPDRENVPKKFKSIPVSSQNIAIFEDLQLCNRHSLIEPVDTKHMYYAAIESKSCRLTTLGRHYWRLIEKGLL